MQSLVLRPLTRAKCSLTVPADKSISHRAAILGAIAHGTTEVQNYSTGGDCESTLHCVARMGAGVERKGTSVLITGLGTLGPKEPSDVLCCGNSGTTMRLLAGVLAGYPVFSVLTGDDSLRSRPMKRVVGPLRLMGAAIDGCADGQRAPLCIRGGNLTALEHYETPVASAQVKSSILLAALQAEGTTRVAEPAPSRDHTERMLPLFGAALTAEGSMVSIRGKQQLKAASLEVPGDISSAAFWLALGAMLPGSHISVLGIGINPLRAGLLPVLTRMGAKVQITSTHDTWEPVGDLSVSSDGLFPVEVEPHEIPSLIDEIPILAVCAGMASGTTVIRGARELRHKESDRLSAIAENLRRMGVEVDEDEDSLAIHGRALLRGAPISSKGDHRIAMAFAIAGLVARGETQIDDISCADISYPGFVSVLKKLSERGEAAHG